MSRQDRRPSKSSKGPGKERPEPEKPESEEEEEAPPAWLKKAAERHDQRQKHYASIFEGAKEAVQKGKEELSGMLKRVGDQHKEEEPDEPAPSLFNDAAKAWQDRQQSLGSIFGDAVKAKQAEKDALMKMFERPSKGKDKGKGGR